MKSWLIRYQISCALDSGRPLTARQQAFLQAHPEMARQRDALTQVHASLSNPPPTTVPTELHRGIMTAISRERREQSRGAIPRYGLFWGFAGAATALVLLGVVWMHCRPEPSRGPAIASGSAGLELASSALQTGEELHSELAPVVMRPLWEEWDRANLDWEQAKAFLISSLP